MGTGMVCYPWFWFNQQQTSTRVPTKVLPLDLISSMHQINIYNHSYLQRNSVQIYKWKQLMFPRDRKVQPVKKWHSLKKVIHTFIYKLSGIAKRGNRYVWSQLKTRWAFSSLKKEKKSHFYSISHFWLRF